ncbi:MAG: hypothetical protein M9894_05215 [Planctomycetes bacterium]|nr:hypothetical protein [Planctomycetota bacterium]
MPRSTAVLILLLALTPALAQEEGAPPAPSSPAVAEEAAALKARVAAGALPPERLEVAAWLGHEPAQVALGREVERPREALRRSGHEAGVRIMLAAARVTLARWGGEAPEPLTGALGAVDAWLACPCPEHAAPCGAAEEAVRALSEGLFDIDLGAPDAEERLEDMERRVQVVLAVGAVALAVRAPVEDQPDSPMPVSELVGHVLGNAVAAEMHAARADRPADPSPEAAGRMLEPYMGGGHGGRERRGKPRDAVDDEVERWAEAMARFKAACQARVLAELRAAVVPWLLGAN